MANTITSPNLLSENRKELKRVVSSLDEMVNSFAGVTYITRGGKKLNAQFETVKRMLIRTEQNLWYAQKCANAFAGINKLPEEQPYSFIANSFAAPKYSVVIDCDAVLIEVGLLKKDVGAINQIKANVTKAKREFQDIKITEQLVSTLNVFDILFPPGALMKLANIDRVKNTAVDSLEAAEKALNNIAAYYDNVARKIEGDTNRFREVEENLRLSFFQEAIQKTSELTKESKPKDEVVLEGISALQNKQAEYAEIYGTKSPEITAEIARLESLLAVYLKHNMKRSMNQHSYSIFYENGSNVGCSATAYAIAISIIAKKDVDPTKYWGANGCTWSYKENNKKKTPQTYNYGKLYEHLRSGRPIVLHYDYKTSSRSSTHYVTVIGIRKGADYTNVQLNDLIVIDPADGKEKTIKQLRSGLKVFTPKRMILM